MAPNFGRRALQARSGAKRQIPEPAGLDRRGATVGDVVRRSISLGTSRLVQYESGVALGDDAEAVHQARVATRRLRSDLRTFREALDGDWVKATREELRWLGELLGEVRDRDVLLSRLRTTATSLPPSDVPRAGGLLARLEAERAAALDVARCSLGSERYRHLVGGLAEAAAEPPSTEAATTRAKDVVARLVRGPWRSLRAGVSSLPSEPTDAELHRIRILSKRCRYAAEAVTPVAGGRAARFADRLADLQDVLGGLHDAVVAEQWLRDAVGRSAPEAIVAGEMIAGERAEAAAKRDAWRASWRRVHRKELTRWLKS